MRASVLPHEPLIRLLAFLGIFLVLALCEILAPRRSRRIPRRLRWPGNLALVALDTACVRVLFPLAVAGIALRAEEARIGILHLVEIPSAARVVIGVIALDLVIYAQHVAFHFVPWLWRFHLVHHADREIDVTTGLRFHPVEILLSIGIKAGAVYAIGVPALGVVLFEIILNATSMFNHSNLRITGVPDRLIRALLVTPDMHRVHHSVIVRETNSNFSFNLSVWDRVFGTYTPQPRDGHLGMTIGLSEYQKTESWRWLWMLKIPFTRP